MSEKPSCQECRAWMEDAFSGELEPALKPRLEAHLGECAECREVWADFQTLRRGMEVLAEVEGPSLRAQTNILRAAEAKAERRAAKRAGLWSWLLRPATVAFATLLLVAGIGYLGREELQKRKAAEQMGPAIAPQGTSAQEAPADTLTAPPPPRLKQESAPVAPAKPKLAAPQPDAAATKPPAAEGRLDAKEGLRMKDGDAPAGGDRLLQSPPPPPPAPATATGAASEAAPAPMKSLAKPAAEPKPSDLERSAPAAPQPASIPEAQRGLGGAASTGGATEIKGEDKAKKREKTAAPAPLPAEVAAPGEAEKNLQQEKADERFQEQDAGARYQSLLNAAKAKIRRADYAGALEDLLAAQRIRDGKEIQDLILLCRSHLRGDG